jgi:hypothetical protein
LRLAAGRTMRRVLVGDGADIAATVELVSRSGTRIRARTSSDVMFPLWLPQAHRVERRCDEKAVGGRRKVLVFGLLHSDFISRTFH